MVEDVKWKYTEVTCYFHERDRILKEYGEKGWEAWSINAGIATIKILFKRPYVTNNPLNYPR